MPLAWTLPRSCQVVTLSRALPPASVLVAASRASALGEFSAAKAGAAAAAQIRMAGAIRTKPIIGGPPIPLPRACARDRPIVKDWNESWMICNDLGFVDGSRGPER